MKNEIWQTKKEFEDNLAIDPKVNDKNFFLKYMKSRNQPGLLND